ncbi:MAG: hypothetical protein K2M55_05755 [Muribaculaceae bacterium]|nr:hypothetical protein [Muribaculaceae bacterium]
MPQPIPSILSDALQSLGVPHTRSWSDTAFDAMTFRSLFGLSKLLQEYGVDSEAYMLTNKADDLQRLTTGPFLAHVPDGFVIVESVAPDSVTINEGTGAHSVPVADFLNRWTGEVLLMYPRPDACEPHYAEHRFLDIAARAKRVVLALAVLFILVCGVVASGVWHSFGGMALVVIDIVGIYVTYNLLLKTYGIHSDHADNICGIIDRNGCHTVLSTDASKFFGLFGWSEVGFAYFTVSLAVLLLFPGEIRWLALINACCCPFSFWSIWYQKYRAKAWCTLCLLTQACLWLSLGAYICTGAFTGLWPLRLPLFVIGATYIAALLALNSLSPYLTREQ